MGQQQLLLVILVTIIVGIATVVAINIFGTAAEQANQDAVRQDLMGAAAQAQGIWARPIMLGGTGGNFGETSITDEQFAQRIGIPGIINGLEIANENAEYEITARAGNLVTIIATPTSHPDQITLNVERLASGNWETRLTIDGQTVTMGGDATTTP